MQYSAYYKNMIKERFNQCGYTTQGFKAGDVSILAFCQCFKAKYRYWNLRFFNRENELNHPERCK